MNKKNSINSSNLRTRERISESNQCNYCPDLCDLALSIALLAIIRVRGQPTMEVCFFVFVLLSNFNFVTKFPVFGYHFLKFSLLFSV